MKNSVARTGSWRASFMHVFHCTRRTRSTNLQLYCTQRTANWLVLFCQTSSPPCNCITDLNRYFCCCCHPMWHANFNGNTCSSKLVTPKLACLLVQCTHDIYVRIVNYASLHMWWQFRKQIKRYLTNEWKNLALNVCTYELNTIMHNAKKLIKDYVNCTRTHILINCIQFVSIVRSVPASVLGTYGGFAWHIGQSTHKLLSHSVSQKRWLLHTAMLGFAAKFQ